MGLCKNLKKKKLFMATKKATRRREQINLSIIERKLRDTGHEVNNLSINLKGSDSGKILSLV